jgi:DNA polymerase (family 10)
VPDASSQELARIFEEIAELLELKGENVFKVRAYDRAARALRGLNRPLQELYDSGELLEVPGIGKGIAEKVGQYLRTGTVELHQQLSREFPSQILALTQVPGLGPKKAAILYRELGIQSLEELKRALEEGRVRGLPGFGARSEGKLLAALRQVHQVSARTPLATADEAARGLAEILRGVPGVQRVEAAGSLRRRRETVGDLDLLCASEDAEPVMEAFCTAPRVVEVLARGSTKSSVRLREGLQVDLRVVPLACFGAALQYFTGSKDHNVALRLRCERRGWKLNEYGLFDSQGRPLAREREEDIYAALGLPWIPPELRETGEEIEAAEKGLLPRLVEEADIRGNLHTHSDWSDGTATLEQLAREAERRGYQYLAVTDHSRSLAMANGLSLERLERQGAEIEALNQRFRVRLLRGTECDIKADGSMDYPDEVLAGLDVVVGSVHSQFNMPRPEMTRRLLRAIENPHVDIIGHPTGRYIGRRPGYDVDWEEILAAARRTGTALEINCQPDRLDLRDSDARRAGQTGVPLAVGTDAHGLAGFDYLWLGIGVARRAWLGPEGILNTRDLGELLAWLQRT